MSAHVSSRNAGTMAKRRRSRPREVGRAFQSGASAAFDAFVGCGNLCEAGAGFAPRVGVHLGHALRCRRFRPLLSALGLPHARTRSWGSPFDYEQQALLYVPRELPEPNTPEHTHAVIRAALPVDRGERRAAHSCSSRVCARCAKPMRSERGVSGTRGSTYPVLMQGDSSRTELLERFRKLGNAVLIGSQSFWEGVDVRGEALSLVVIDKLPFSAPDDPVLAARIDKLNRRRPQRVSGASAAARGDHAQAGRRPAHTRRERPRRADDLRSAPLLEDYGRRILLSLPPMRRTRAEADAVAFLQAPRRSA